VAVALVAGCGGDSEPSADQTPTVPQLTVPQTDEAEPPPAATEDAPPPADPQPAPPGPDDGAPAPAPAPPADTPENDTPPPADSPAERFEQFCEDNPGACG